MACRLCALLLASLALAIRRRESKVTSLGFANIALLPFRWKYLTLWLFHSMLVVLCLLF